MQVETFLLPNNTALDKDYDNNVHGFKGPLSIALPGTPTEIDARIANTTQELAEFSNVNPDFNSGNTLGLGKHYVSSMLYCSECITVPLQGQHKQLSPMIAGGARPQMLT